MNVRFLVDYRGKLTDEQFFEAGSVADLPNGDALVEAGRAEPVEDAAPEPTADPVVEANEPKPNNPKKGARKK